MTPEEQAQELLRRTQAGVLEKPDSRAASNQYDAIRERYGIGQKGGLDDPNVGGSKFGFGRLTNKGDKIQELIQAGTIQYNPSTGKFDIPQQDRTFLGISDADIGRAVLIQRQGERVKELEAQGLGGMTAQELGFNAGTSRAGYLGAINTEKGLRAGEDLLTQNGVTLEQLQLKPGRYDDNYLSPRIATYLQSQETETVESGRGYQTSEREGAEEAAESLQQNQIESQESLQENQIEATRELDVQQGNRSTDQLNATLGQQWNLAQQQSRDAEKRFLAQMADNAAQRTADTKLSMQQFQLQMDQMDRRDARDERREEKDRRAQLMALLMRGLGQLGAGFSSI
jgi:hypothetical protein